MTETDTLLIAGLAIAAAMTIVAVACCLPEIRAWQRRHKLARLREQAEVLHERMVDNIGTGPLRGWRRDISEYEQVKEQIKELENQP